MLMIWQHMKNDFKLYLQHYCNLKEINQNVYQWWFLYCYTVIIGDILFSSYFAYFPNFIESACMPFILGRGRERETCRLSFFCFRCKCSGITNSLPSPHTYNCHRFPPSLPVRENNISILVLNDCTENLKKSQFPPPPQANIIC